MTRARIIDAERWRAHYPAPRPGRYAARGSTEWAWCRIAPQRETRPNGI